MILDTSPLVRLESHLPPQQMSMTKIIARVGKGTASWSQCKNLWSWYPVSAAERNSLLFQLGWFCPEKFSIRSFIRPPFSFPISCSMPAFFSSGWMDLCGVWCVFLCGMLLVFVLRMQERKFWMCFESFVGPQQINKENKIQNKKTGYYNKPKSSLWQFPNKIYI